MTTKLKFKCTRMEPGNEDPLKGLNVTFEPVEGLPTKDDKGHWDVTGSFKLKTKDKSKVEEFEVGSEYELTLTKVAKPKEQVSSGEVTV